MITLPKLIEALRLRPTFDAVAWKSKMSSKLSLLQLMVGAGVAAYALLPDRIAESLPMWSLIALGATTIITAMLTVLAANTSQAKVAEKAAEAAVNDPSGEET